MAKAPKVPADVFVREWCAASSVNDVAKALGYSIAAVTFYAKRLRELGVNLPSMRKRNTPVDVPGLNQLIRELETK